MDRYLFIAESVTYARKGVILLNDAGIKASIKRISQKKGRSGCSFAIEAYADPDDAVNILKNGNVRVLYTLPGGVLS